MPNIIDSYTPTPDAITGPIYGNSVQEGFGQCFTGNGEKVVETSWKLSRTNNPTGNVIAKIWTMTGTFGVDGNVGTVLATSDPLDVSTVPISPAAGETSNFTFSGVNRYPTVNGTHYVSTYEYLGGDGSNFIQMSYKGPPAVHPATWVVRVNGVWTAFDLSIDLYFIVWGVDEVDLTGVAANPQIGDGTVVIGVPPTPVVHPNQRGGLLYDSGREWIKREERLRELKRHDNDDVEIVKVLTEFLSRM